MFANVEKYDDVTSIVAQTNANKRYLILAGSGFDFYSLAKSMDATWMGAVFPSIIFGEALYEHSAIVLELRDSSQMLWIDHTLTQEIPDRLVHLVIVDGMDPCIDAKMDYLFANTSEKAMLFGGGSSAMGKEPLYMYNGHVLDKEGMILISSDVTFGLAVQHGMKVFEECSFVTKASKNIVAEIDAMDAFSYYQKEIETKFGEKVTRHNLFEIGLKYPLMFEKAFNEKTARIPVSTDGKNLSFMGDVSADTVVSIGVAQKDAFIEAASSAANSAKNSLDRSANLCLVFSCFGRKSFLKEDFMQELHDIYGTIEQKNMVGALSMGEIANTSEHYLDFFNYTCVIGIE